MQKLKLELLSLLAECKTTKEQNNAINIALEKQCDKDINKAVILCEPLAKSAFILNRYYQLISEYEDQISVN